MGTDTIGTLIHSAKNLHDYEDIFTLCLRNVVTDGSWRDFTLKSGFHHTFETFPDFLAWVGVDRSELIAVLRVRGEDALAAAVLAEGIEPVGENGNGPGRGHKRVCDTKAFTTQQDSTYVVARLKRDDPALAKQVIAGEITANAAAIASGIRKPYARHRTDDPNRAIQSLLRHYTREQLTAALLGGEA